MLRGVALVNIFADDVPAAKRWYTEFFGIDPYIERPDAEHPEYVEFRLGDYRQEFGIINRRYAPYGSSAEPAGAIINWHVGDLDATLDRLQAMGASVLEPMTERGEGFVTASVVDPFGNILGVMYNPHYVDVLGATDNAWAAPAAGASAPAAGLLLATTRPRAAARRSGRTGGCSAPGRRRCGRR